MRWTGVRRAAGRAAGLVCVWALLVPGVARGAVLARYEFSGTAAPAVTGEGVTASHFQYDKEYLFWGLDGSVGNPPGSFSWLPRFSTLGDAKLFELSAVTTLAPAPGRARSLQSFGIDLSAYSVANDSFDGQVAVFTSLDGYTAPIYVNFASDTGKADGFLSPWSVFDSPGPAINPLYQNVMGPIEFHYYTAGTVGGALYLDNIRISGTTAVVPEPATAGIAAAAALAASMMRRRKPR
jgi:hypothetical protein